MIKYLAILISIGASFMTSGCLAKTEDMHREAPTISVDQLAQNFGTQKAEAAKFWNLYEQGMKYQQEKRHDDAIRVFEEALKKYSLLRPEQSAAIKQLVIVNAEKGDYERAIKYCELGADVTMSSEQKLFFEKQAEELRRKI